MASNKGRVLFLLKYLIDNTDYAHDLTNSDIMDAYAKNGYSATEKTVRGDLNELIDTGFPVYKTDNPGHANFYIYDQPFDITELKMIVDAVAAARFISDDECNDVISKLRHLRRGYINDGPATISEPAKRIHTKHKGLYVHMSKISEAMEAGRKISYQYINYSTSVMMANSISIRPTPSSGARTATISLDSWTNVPAS